MQSKKVTERIKDKAFELLQQHPEGLRYSELRNKIQEFDPAFNGNTINGSIWNLEIAFPDKVYKPSKGLFRLLAFKNQEQGAPATPGSLALAASKIKEEDFYAPFADWLKNEIEDVTHAIPLGGNIFKDKWGTPDVVGKKESRRSDVIKGPTEIVSAEIKTDSNQLITAFGQACAYKLFSHKAYLVVPGQSADDEISRLDSLCQIFGIGLVTFDATKPANPDFRILVRPSRHEPDLFYTNKYMMRIEKELFA
ncbi:MAG: hypothetical protein LBI48_10160 [Burkholderiaceae bacterium]|jgi:hypothetical protein|nr:hypothetical protein [Burkholderiaceae bacterium]